jgi:hypothetical protein
MITGRINQFACFCIYFSSMLLSFEREKHRQNISTNLCRKDIVCLIVAGMDICRLYLKNSTHPSHISMIILDSFSEQEIRGSKTSPFKNLNKLNQLFTTDQLGYIDFSRLLCLDLSKLQSFSSPLL